MTKFFAKGHQHGDSRHLSITYVDENSIHVVIHRRRDSSLVEAYTSSQDFISAVGGLKPGRYKHTSFPIKSLQSLSWSDCNHKLVFQYDAGSHNRDIKTHINSVATREKMLAAIEQGLGRKLRREDKPAGIFRAAWLNILGATLSLTLACFFYFAWNPANLPGGLKGLIIRQLGPTGCGLIALAFVAGACWDGYKKMKKDPRVFRCYV